MASSCQWCFNTLYMMRHLEEYLTEQTRIVLGSIERDDEALRPSWITQAYRDLHQCFECVMAYHSAIEEALEDDDNPMASTRQQIHQSDISRLKAALMFDDGNIEHSITDGYTSFKEVLKYPRFLFDKDISDLVVSYISKMAGGNLMEQLDQDSQAQFPGLYLLLIHPDEQVQRWSLEAVRSIHFHNPIDTLAYEELEGVVDWMLEGVAHYRMEENSPENITALPDHLCSLSSKMYWLGICMLVKSMDKACIQNSLLSSTSKNKKLLDTVINTLEYTADSMSNSNPVRAAESAVSIGSSCRGDSSFWPALEILTVLLKNHEHYCWQSTSKHPSHVVKTILGNPEFIAYLQDLANREIDTEDDPFLSNSQFVYETCISELGEEIDDDFCQPSSSCSGFDTTKETESSEVSVMSWILPFVRSVINFCPDVSEPILRKIVSALSSIFCISIKQHPVIRSSNLIVSAPILLKESTNIAAITKKLTDCALDILAQFIDFLFGKEFFDFMLKEGKQWLPIFTAVSRLILPMPGNGMASSDVHTRATPLLITGVQTVCNTIFNIIDSPVGRELPIHSELIVLFDLKRNSTLQSHSNLLKRALLPRGRKGFLRDTLVTVLKVCNSRQDIVGPFYSRDPTTMAVRPEDTLTIPPCIAVEIKQEPPEESGDIVQDNSIDSPKPHELKPRKKLSLSLNKNRKSLNNTTLSESFDEPSGLVTPTLAVKKEEPDLDEIKMENFVLNTNGNNWSSHRTFGNEWISADQDMTQGNEDFKLDLDSESNSSEINVLSDSNSDDSLLPPLYGSNNTPASNATPRGQGKPVARSPVCGHTKRRKKRNHLHVIIISSDEDSSDEFTLPVAKKLDTKTVSCNDTNGRSSQPHTEWLSASEVNESSIALTKFFLASDSMKDARISTPTNTTGNHVVPTTSSHVSATISSGKTVLDKTIDDSEHSEMDRDDNHGRELVSQPQISPRPLSLRLKKLTTDVIDEVKDQIVNKELCCVSPFSKYSKECDDFKKVLCDAQQDDRESLVVSIDIAHFKRLRKAKSKRKEIPAVAIETGTDRRVTQQSAAVPMDTSTDHRVTKQSSVPKDFDTDHRKEHRVRKQSSVSKSTDTRYRVMKKLSIPMNTDTRHGVTKQSSAPAVSMDTGTDHRVTQQSTVSMDTGTQQSAVPMDTGTDRMITQQSAVSMDTVTDRRVTQQSAVSMDTGTDRRVTQQSAVSMDTGTNLEQPFCDDISKALDIDDNDTMELENVQPFKDPRLNKPLNNTTTASKEKTFNQKCNRDDNIILNGRGVTQRPPFSSSRMAPFADRVDNHLKPATPSEPSWKNPSSKQLSKTTETAKMTTNTSHTSRNGVPSSHPSSSLVHRRALPQPTTNVNQVFDKQSSIKGATTLIEKILKWPVQMFSECECPSESCIDLLDTIPADAPDIYQSLSEYQKTFSTLSLVELQQEIIDACNGPSTFDKSIIAEDPKIDYGNNQSILRCTAHIPSTYNIATLNYKLAKVIFVVAERCISKFGLILRSSVDSTTSVSSNDSSYSVVYLKIQLGPISNQLKCHRQISIVPLVDLIRYVRRWDALHSVSQSLLLGNILIPNGQNHVAICPSHSVSYDKSLPSTLRLEENKWQDSVIRDVVNMVNKEYAHPRILLVKGAPGTGKTRVVTKMIPSILESLRNGQVTTASNDSPLPGRRRSSVSSTQGHRILVCCSSDSGTDEVINRLAMNPSTMVKGTPVWKKYHDLNDITTWLDDQYKGIRVVRVGGDEKRMNCIVKDLTWNGLRQQILAPNQEHRRSVYGELDRLQKEINKHESCIRSIEGESRELTLAMENLDESAIGEKQSSLAKLSNRILKHKCEKCELEKQKKELQAKRSRIDAFEQFTTNRILRQADVVCCCLITSGRNELQKIFKEPMHFSCVIVDEASYCCELDTLLPISYGSTKLILVGDPTGQHPLTSDTTLRSELAAKHGYGRSMFSRILDYLEKDGNEFPSLTIQYRMKRLLCDFPSQYFYSGKLLTHALCTYSKTAVKFPPFRVFDFEEKDNSDSEIEFLVKFVEQLLAKCISQSQIGVIVPFGKDKQIFSALHEKLNTRKIEVGYVDMFQGKEKDVIIILPCLKTAGMKPQESCISGFQKLKISLTRCKEALYVIGQLNSLKESDLGWKDFIDFMECRNLYTTQSSVNDVSSIFHQQDKQAICDIRTPTESTTATDEARRKLFPTSLFTPSCTQTNPPQSTSTVSVQPTDTTTSAMSTGTTSTIPTGTTSTIPPGTVITTGTTSTIPTGTTSTIPPGTVITTGTTSTIPTGTTSTIPPGTVITTGTTSTIPTGTTNTIPPGTIIPTGTNSITATGTNCTVVLNNSHVLSADTSSNGTSNTTSISSINNSKSITLLTSHTTTTMMTQHSSPSSTKTISLLSSDSKHTSQQPIGHTSQPPPLISYPEVSHQLNSSNESDDSYHPVTDHEPVCHWPDSQSIVNSSVEQQFQFTVLDYNKSFATPPVGSRPTGYGGQKMRKAHAPQEEIMLYRDPDTAKAFRDARLSSFTN